MPRTESTWKALISVPVALALVGGFLFCNSGVKPDQAMLAGLAPDKPGQNGLEVLNEARTLKPWKLMEKRNLVVAVKTAQSLLESQPNDVAVNYCAAVVLKASNCVGDAIEQMKRTIALAPHNKDLRMEYARMLAESNRVEEALIQYRQVINQAPKLTAPRRELAQLYLNTDRPAECAKELEELLSVVPNDYAARKARGIALARAGKAQDGMEEYLAGESYQRGQSDAVRAILGTWPDIDKAKFDLEQQAEREPDNYLPKLRLGTICLYYDHPRDAITYLNEARKLAPNSNSEIYRSLCVAYKRMGNNKQAVVSFQQAVAIDQEQAKASKHRSGAGTTQ